MPKARWFWLTVLILAALTVVASNPLFRFR